MSAESESCFRVAIIGGGVTGSVALTELLERSSLHVTLFDQGRGLGGRSSHRCVTASGDVVAPGSAETEYAFDHGCQFFRADTARFREQILSRWIQDGVAAAWRPKFLATAPKAQFFGVPSDDTVYCGIGGMHNLVAAPVQNAITKYPQSVALRSATRVASVERRGERWELLGVAGRAALHDTPEAESHANGESLGVFDAVLFTDVSMSAESWHRASAGLPADFIKEALPDLEKRPRVCLFTAMVAFDAPLFSDDTGGIALDDETLWWASRTNSKPGQEQLARECWTLVSTPSYAAAEVAKVNMRDPTTGAFVPQSRAYLESDDGPAATLLRAFTAQLAGLGVVMPKVLYLTAQRWGSAFPSPVDSGVDVLGTRYTTANLLPLVPTDVKDEVDFAHSADGLYYAGDFIAKSLPPGIEAAALSGHDAAKHIAARFSS